MTKKAIVLGLFLLSVSISKAQLYFKNNTDDPVFVCVTMYYNNKNSKYWGSEGWWRVNPGYKVQISSAIGFNNNIYYFAKSAISRKEYTGEYNMLVHPTDKFFIKNCDKDYVKKENPQYVYKKFRHIDMNSKLLQTKYTIEFNY